ncbi:MAG: hypothetical protein U0414_09235 [Polyangiaceae bacterium]
MKTKLLVAVAVLGCAAFAAGCDDSSGSGGAGGATASSGSSSTKATTGSSMTTTTGSNMTSSSSGGGTCSVTGTKDTCQHACEALYACAAVNDCSGADLCAGVSDDSKKTAFIGTDMGTCKGTPAMACGKDQDCPMVGGQKDTCQGGCLIGCASNMGLLAVVNPMDCKDTIDTLSTLNPGFAAFCKGP